MNDINVDIYEGTDDSIYCEFIEPSDRNCKAHCILNIRNNATMDIIGLFLTPNEESKEFFKTLIDLAMVTLKQRVAHRNNNSYIETTHNNKYIFQCGLNSYQQFAENDREGTLISFQKTLSIVENILFEAECTIDIFLYLSQKNIYENEYREGILDTFWKSYKLRITETNNPTIIINPGKHLQLGRPCIPPRHKEASLPHLKTYTHSYTGPSLWCNCLPFFGRQRPRILNRTQIVPLSP